MRSFDVDTFSLDPSSGGSGSGLALVQSFTSDRSFERIRLCAGPDIDNADRCKTLGHVIAAELRIFEKHVHLPFKYRI